MARVVALEWGVKQSFRGYVEAMGGTIELTDGATRTADGGFAFPAAPESTLSIDGGTVAGQGVFHGAVRFRAHGGMLDVSLAGFGVEGAAVTVDDRGRRAPIAEFDLASVDVGGDGALVFPAAATMDTYQIVGDHYPPRTPLDPVRLVLG